MPVTYVDNTAVFDAAVGVDEAERLLEWTHEHPHGTADLGACTHLHAADLQVLMAARFPVAVWPADEDLKTWLKAALAAGTRVGH
jgi:hypothetical protein